jgi:pimeloyl-ACP methyl ester carboxylesterase
MSIGRTWRAGRPGSVMSYLIRRFSIAAMVVLSVAACGSPEGAGLPPTARPTFTPTSCPFSLIGSKLKPGSVHCGFVLVPEDRTVNHSPTIRLAVAVFKAQWLHAAPDPLIYLIGGPGGYVVSPMGSQIVQDGMPDFVGNRDLILVDQRGTGLSQPGLTCPEMYVARDRALTLHVSEARRWSMLLTAVRSCRTRLAKEGIDLGAYNTVENAADIAALRTALGYRDVDVYGGSYGSQLAQQLMRDHPHGIRSVVMDAVVMPQYQMDDQIPNAWHSLQVLFKDCGADTSICRILYPHLERTFTGLIGHLQTHPPTLRVSFGDVNRTYDVKLTAWEFLGTLRSALMWPDYIALMPKLIADTSRGDYRLITQLENDIGFSNDIFTPDMGMLFSMTCSSNVIRYSRANVTDKATVLPPSVRPVMVAAVDRVLTACAAWRVPYRSAVIHTYFRTRIPTLLLPGAFDPILAPADATAVARHLTHSGVVFFPTLSHNVVGTGLCQDSIVRAFLSDPNRRPDTSCVSGMTLVFQ